ncbi:GrpB family protein [Cytobacillus kochii]|uniref:GrpB family protein n=1 Tax=Cytobacillus kochii TaxID=859143 RepID=UPI00203C2011|nr:GrpB family protein [Cytobacillus kochii]MCM3324759.1 GrpB family protein [Cytobacillus kochii]MCM3347152.1 GrpB family protein [Cytobacillus kochii]
MELGLGRNEVILVPHDEGWKKEFEKVKEEIHNATSIDHKKIEHIGSTSIINIMTKPIIDILVGVENIQAINSKLIEDLKKIGFYRLRVERQNEVVFAKFTDESFKVKTHFLHLVNFDGELWKDLIFFRDFLNLDEPSRVAYEDIKKNFVKFQSKGIDEYTESKEKFVKDIIAKRTS